MVQGRWSDLRAWVVPDSSLPLERQFFQWLTMLGGAVSFLVVLPVNNYQGLSPWVNRGIVVFGLLSLGFAWAAKRGHYCLKSMLLSLVICLDILWLPNGGSQGSIGLYFFTAVLFLVLFFRGAARATGLVLLLADILGLLFIEHAWPQLVTPFPSASDRFLDLAAGYLICLPICALMLWVVLKGFDQERERLAESENMYRECLERQGEGFSMVDDQECFQMANPVAEQIFGVRPGGLLGRSLLDFLPDDQRELVQVQSRIRAEGHASTYELRIRRTDGAIRTLLITATPRFERYGGSLQVIGVFRDITERRDAEDRLRESEEKFRSYIEQSIDVIFTLSTEGTFLFASPAWERHFGIPVDQIIGKPFVPFIHPEDVQPCTEHLTRVLTSGQAESSPPYRVRHSDGNWRWFQANGTRLVTSTGELRYMGVAHDITERQQAEEAIRESEERYRTQFDRASEGIFALSPQGDLLEVNEAMAKMHGYTREEMRAINLRDLDTPESFLRSLDRMNRLLAGEALTFEVEHYHKDGHAFPMEVSASLVSTGGRPVILCFHRDITGRKRAEETERLLVQEKQQTQKMESLGSLAGGVAHDFNNMLGGIMGYADLLMAGETDPTRQKYLKTILAASSRSAELTQKLLAFGRRGKNRVEPLDLLVMVEDCLAMIRPSTSPDLQVVVAMEGCPTVDGDPSQIHQVLVNLCINAMEAMPERGTLTLSYSVQEVSEATHPGLPVPAGKYVELAVSDTGLGMSQEIQQRIFEPFFTTKNSSGVSGTGLGLSTAYGIVRAHGGGITVNSSRGKGSIFRLFLPVGTMPPTGWNAVTGGTRGEGLVLLVEDEPLLRDLGVSVLESLGYEVATAGDGKEAVETYGRIHDRLSAVLLDLKMPRMSGREAFIELRRIDSTVPVIICTGYGENEEVQELLTLGARGLLAKPYQISTLAEKLRNVLVG